MSHLCVNCKRRAISYLIGRIVVKSVFPVPHCGAASRACLLSCRPAPLSMPLSTTKRHVRQTLAVVVSSAKVGRVKRFSPKYLMPFNSSANLLESGGNPVEMTAFPSLGVAHSFCRLPVKQNIVGKYQIVLLSPMRCPTSNCCFNSLNIRTAALKSIPDMMNGWVLWRASYRFRVVMPLLVCLYAGVYFPCSLQYQLVQSYRVKMSAYVCTYRWPT